MNAVEIEEAVSQLATQPFDAAEFPFQFLAAFGNKDTTLKKLRSGNSNASDVAGGVLQRNNIHMAIAKSGEVSAKLAELKASPKTLAQKAKFILATDGDMLEAEDLSNSETVACTYADFANHFGFFLPLAGITTVKQIRDNPVDIQATGRLNRLYVELLKVNEDWATAARRPDMNHFMARLIFCFFAEDTDIFNGDDLFTATITQMSDRDASNTHEVIAELFRAMNTPTRHEGNPDSRYRKAANIKSWADAFPYVNGGLFSGSTDVPHFSKMARAYLLHAGSLNWKHINPDIFGSMIQAVADDDERGELGMHYTSVPNILKVLNPLFLDDLRAELESAQDNTRSLLNLRKRMSKIRVFDPACGSGNFLVIAYKEMRAIEAEINQQRDEVSRASEIPLTNFRGIELRDFPAEISRLALIIAEYQCDVLYRGQKLALNEFLPLDAMNWITCGNALRLDWLSICPPTGTGVKFVAEDLFHTPLDQAQIDFENEGGETYICGNPPFSGFNSQTPEQKSELETSLSFTNDHKYFDYVSGWFYKAACCLKHFDACAFVSTNSIVQGLQVPILWRPIFEMGIKIHFAHETFIWKNNAANNAGVFCVIVGLTKGQSKLTIYGEDFKKNASNINAYLADAASVFVDRSQFSIASLPPMTTGNVAYDGGNLIISEQERSDYLKLSADLYKAFRPLTGSKEFIRGERRYCIWITREELLTNEMSKFLGDRFDAVKASRKAGGKIAKNYSHVPFRFYMTNESRNNQIVVPRVSSVRREYLPIGYLDKSFIISDSAQSVCDAPLWTFALLASKLHLAWVHTVSGKLKGDFRYSAIICYNTFPVPPLTEKNKADLTRCAEDILLAREAHWPKTIADLYDPDGMPDNLRAAHARNDEVLERIYIGRRFKNDTERLEKLFDMYTKMTANKSNASSKAVKSKGKTA
jgi:hypothetical protein